jgi:EAL domain-containing protein (putative c-di-GMP-specific phosphodiesterase class I)
VKLDRALVVAAEYDPAARNSIDRIVEATHGIGARVIAEGIETRRQHALAIEAGCDFVQGFLFCKPACPPAAAIFTPARLNAA